MKIIYAHEPIVNLHKSVAILGPTPRSNEVKSWRPEFIQALKDQNFDGTVLVPEASDGVWKNNYDEQIEWELEMIEKAKLIAFWIPRSLPDMPAFTTNVEFGYCIGKGKYIIYGRPNDAVKMSYLDYINNRYNEFCFIQNKPYDNINDMTKAIIDWFK